MQTNVKFLNPFKANVDNFLVVFKNIHISSCRWTLIKKEIEGEIKYVSMILAFIPDIENTKNLSTQEKDMTAFWENIPEFLAKIEKEVEP